MIEVPGGRKLRQFLREVRQSAGLSQQAVADRVSARLDLDRPLTAAAVGEWERYGRHPPLAVMAAWAGVLGHRLTVQIDQREPEALRSDVMDLARLLERLPPDDLRAVAHVIRGMADRF